MITIKNKIPILLIILVLVIVVYSKLTFEEEVMEEPTIVDESIELNVEFGDEKLVELEDVDIYQVEYIANDLDKVSKFLDPFETERYNSLLIFYAMYIPEALNSYEDVEGFFDLNERTIGKYLGIYDVDDFKLFYEDVAKLNITSSSRFIDIYILNVSKEDNLLKSKIKIDYGSDTLEIEHYINYVYIEGISNLFIYHDY